jgi:hypothetical protein
VTNARTAADVEEGIRVELEAMTVQDRDPQTVLRLNVLCDMAHERETQLLTIMLARKQLGRAVETGLELIEKFLLTYYVAPHHRPLFARVNDTLLAPDVGGLTLVASRAWN